jgi:hypothetical protein
MFKGNKGEWSELYTLIKLLGEEKLHAADENLEKIEDTFFVVKEIFKNEFNPPIKYSVNGTVKIINSNNDNIITEIPKKTFLENSIALYKAIKSGKGRTFTIPEIESFLKEIEISSLKAPSQTTADIHIKLYDPRTELQPKLGYSIKSLIGGNSTLFNPGKGTNFIYKINTPPNFNIDKFNTDTYQKRYKLVKRLRRLYETENLNIEFDNVESDSLYRNLFLIDSDLPRLVAQLLLYRYKENESNLFQLAQILEEENPLSYPQDTDRAYYKYKLKKMLRDMSMGMTAETPWNGDFDASGGTLVVRDDGEVVCYHVYDIQKFESYLIGNTYLETPSTGEDKSKPGYSKPKDKGKNYNFGWLYEEGDEIFLKLNLQVRYSN